MKSQELWIIEREENGEWRYGETHLREQDAVDSVRLLGPHFGRHYRVTRWVRPAWDPVVELCGKCEECREGITCRDFPNIGEES